LALAVVALAGLVGCSAAAPRTLEPPAPATAAATSPTVRPEPDAVADSQPEPVAPPAQAYQLGWMPLASTNVPAFRTIHPSWDGRGVLIAILDGGVDPVPGLDRQPDGSGKILDIRDFSGEGRVTLQPVEVAGDLVQVGSAVLRGAGRLRGLHTGGPIYGGVLAEYALGELPAADLNGNGVLGDTLAVVVVRLADGWAVLADTDGDGSLATERPVGDFAQGHRTLGWWTGNGSPPTAVAVNFTGAGTEGPPLLDLVFDTSGHGTHVAGIAAGYRMYGVDGFNGVAPGAGLLALKIANDARGGITVTGSIIRAMDYAIRFAAGRSMPLVINLSYGVGNEEEGRARIDGLVDSVLAEHPDVIMTISAGNDGPGLSTLGFPASARKAISVGATYPGSFLPLQNGRRLDDQVAFFSSRGGELARPDLVVPGVAYSTVPRWDVAEEVKNGTSMAAPHAAGLVALLLSGLAAEQRTADAATLRRALMGSARRLPSATWLDQGAGLPDLLRAWPLLSSPRGVAEPRVTVIGTEGASGVVRQAGATGLQDTVATFRLAAGGARRNPATFLLRPDVPWIVAPRTVTMADAATVTVAYQAAALREPGGYVGVVEGWGQDSASGPDFRLVSTILVPQAIPEDSLVLVQRMAAGQLSRVFLRADSGRGFRVTVTEPRGAPPLAFLHEPGGMPWREGAAEMVTSPDSAAVFEVDARDALTGLYELVTMAGPLYPVASRVVVEASPVRVGTARNRDTVTVSVHNVTDRIIAPAIALDLLGAERRVPVTGRGSADRSIPFTLPGWARRAVVELNLDRDQWSRFTDFGLTLIDADGKQLGASPMNYAVGRLEVDLRPGRPDGQAVVLLSPGFAEPGAGDLWGGRIAIRLYADSPVAVGPEGGPESRLPAGETRQVRLMIPPLPWDLGDGFFPLARVTVREGGRRWPREGGLPNQLPPIMP
jgi:tripeptidyl-peptidase-2